MNIQQGGLYLPKRRLKTTEQQQAAMLRKRIFPLELHPPTPAEARAVNKVVRDLMQESANYRAKTRTGR